MSGKNVEIFRLFEDQLYTAVVADSLDELGHTDQAMAETLRPVTPEATFAGIARTIACMDVHYAPPDPYAREIEAVDSILPGDVVVVSTGESRRNAPWGELLSTAAMARGARGAVIDGLVRDVRKIEKLGFAVFASGIKPVDSRGRGLVIDYNIPVQCGGITVNPGDLVFADYDGVVVIPSDLVADVVRLASEKASNETKSREELRKGRLLRDVYDEFGVL
jgi:regulator of RNase E activity RraA